MTAIIITVGTKQRVPELENVTVHINHLEENGGVFWNLTRCGPKSDDRTPWKHPDINTGYFYISKTKTIDYEFEIERVDLIRDVDINNHCIPPWRSNHFDKTNKEHDKNGHLTYDKNGYAILINNIIPLNPPMHKTDFVSEVSGSSPKTIQNYTLVEDL